MPHVAGGALETAIGEPCTLAGNPMNARFWTYHNGAWARLTLRPGQTLTTHKGRRIDEGWTATTNTWTHGDDAVYWEWVDEGRDCDGYSASVGEAYCPLHALRAHDSEAAYPEAEENRGIMSPEWQRIAAENRDEYAEAAGY